MDEHPLDLLRRKLGESFTDTDYPPGVVPLPKPLPKPIPGATFFPVGRGLSAPDITPPPSWAVVRGKVMILGHNFNAADKYQEALGQDRWERTKTITNLDKLLSDARIPHQHCFFTNCYMGLLPAGKATGRFPTNKGFREICGRFFLVELRLQQPRLIIALGRPARKFLVSLSPDDVAAWKGGKNMGKVKAPWPRKKNVRFTDVDGVQAEVVAVVALTHPSAAKDRACLEAEGKLLRETYKDFVCK